MDTENVSGQNDYRLTSALEDLSDALDEIDAQNTEHDDVNHPSHYTAYKGLEIIDLAEQMNFNRGNAVKYIARAGLKDPSSEVKDLEKAEWYIRREIDRLRAQENPAQTVLFPEVNDEVSYCPDCGMRLTPDDACLNNHGWLNKTSTGNTWVSSTDLKKNVSASPPRCPVCLLFLVQDDDDRLRFHCKDGHGYMVFSQIPHPYTVNGKTYHFGVYPQP